MSLFSLTRFTFHKKKIQQENTDFWHAAESLSLLTESLYEAWVLQPERRRDAESMKEAGLGVAAAPAVAPQVEVVDANTTAEAADATAGVGVEVSEMGGLFVFPGVYGGLSDTDRHAANTMGCVLGQDWSGLLIRQLLCVPCWTAEEVTHMLVWID